MPIFITDENIPEAITQSMNLITETSHFCQVISTRQIPELGRGASDEAIMDYLKSQKDEHVIITNDRDFKKRSLLSQTLTSKNVALFLIKFPKGANFYRRYRFIANHWEKMHEITMKTKFPFAYKVSYKNKFEKI